MSRFKRYLIAEIGIEFKACLYFFAILFYYCMYRILNGSFQADMIVMAEMIFSTYLMGYLQVFVLHNFEESDQLGLYEWGASIGCSVIYMVESYLLCWFDRNLIAGGIFFLYMLLCYICVIIICYIRRQVDTQELNRELDEFKKKGA